MISDLKKNTEGKMQKSIEALKANLGKVRTGRASTGLLDHIQVDYYGTPTQLSQVASVSLLDARTLSVQPWEKTMLAKIEKAIRDSDLGLNPASVGDVVRVPMPALTEERRRDLIKIVRGEGEDAKIAIRNLRRDANSSLKDAVKTKEISEDDDRRMQEEVQKLTDKYISEVDKMLAQKEQDLMQI